MRDVQIEKLSFVAPNALIGTPYGIPYLNKALTIVGQWWIESNPPILVTRLSTGDIILCGLALAEQRKTHYRAFVKALMQQGRTIPWLEDIEACEPSPLSSSL